MGRTNSYGDILTPFQKGTGLSIPSIYIPEMLREEMGLLKVTSGIRSLEAHLESDQQAIRLPWPSDLLLLVSAERYDGGLYAAYRWLPRDMIAQVLDTVRNKLLDFTLDLEKQYPEIEASDEALTSVPVETSRQVFYVTFYGANGRFNLGSSDHSTNVVSEV